MKIMKNKFKRIMAHVLAVITALSVMAAWPADAFAANAGTESALRTAVNKGGTVKLTKNIALTDILIIPEGVTVKLDLNSKTLDRGLTVCQDQGGVIRVEPNATLTVTDSSTNKLGTITGGASWNGGGICNHGTLIFEAGTIKGNKSSHNTYGNGGGIFNDSYNGSTATLTLKGGVIKDNEARSGGGIYNGYGGTLIIEDGSTTKLENATSVKVPTGVVITGNEAKLNGSGINTAGVMSLSGMAELSGNSGNDDLYVAYGKKFTCGALTFTKSFGINANGENVIITEGFGANNQKRADLYFFTTKTEAILRQTAANNGEIQLYTDKKTIAEVYDHGKLTKTTEYDSPADAWQKSQSSWNPCWYYFKNAEMRKYAEELKNGKYPLYYSGSNDWGDFYDKIKSKGGSLEDKTYDAWDGYLQDDCQVKIILGSDWKIDTRLLIWRFRNIIIDLNGHCIDRGGKKQKDGNIAFLEDFAKLTIIDSNPTSKGYDGFTGGVITGGNGDDCGGGFITNDYSELNILGGTIYNCATDEHGGAIYANDPRVVINLKNCTFNSCSTLESGDDCNGGALYVKHAMRVTMENVSFQSCYSEDSGGAVYLANRPGTVRMKNVTFSNNQALDYGGAMAIGGIDDGKAFLLEAVDCSFRYNTCGKDGGAVCISDNDDSGFKYPTIFRNCSFTQNRSDRDGSAFELDDNSVSLQDCTITKNEAKGHGAVYVNDGRKVSVGGKTVIRDNTSFGIYLDKDGDDTRVYSTGLTEGAYITVDTDSGNDSSTLLVKDVSKREEKYFHTLRSGKLSFTKTGTREAYMTTASLFGEGSAALLVCVGISAAVLAAVLVVRKKREEAEAENEAAKG